MKKSGKPFKPEANWRSKSLQNLEKDIWPEPDETYSSIMERGNRLRKIPLGEFTVSDIRFMILQQFGLRYLVPIALEILQKDLLTEADYYEGDLLSSLLQADNSFWSAHPAYFETLKALVSGREEALSERIRSARDFFQSDHYRQ